MNEIEVCNSPKVLIHIGYHKTGTTWFQKELFTRHDMGFIPWSAPRNHVHRIFAIPGPLSEPPTDLVRLMLDEARKVTDAGKYFVISHERLTGYPASGCYDSEIILKRLKRYFPNAKISCLFREQTAMINSMWRQQIVDGGSLSLKQFLYPPEEYIRRVPSFDRDVYLYSRLFRKYTDEFGADNILFAPYEHFLQDPGTVLFQLASLLENSAMRTCVEELVEGMKRPNPSLSLTVIHIQRILNLLFARTQMSPNCLLDLGSANIRGVMKMVSRYFGKYVFAPLDRYFLDRNKEKAARYCGEYYNDDNLIMSEMLSVDLSRFGYKAQTTEGVIS